MNPFRHGCAVDGEFFCPRPELERQLRSFAESGQNVVVHGERRMGKTSLIRHAIGGMRKMRMLYVDLYCIQTLSDFCRRVMNGISEANESMSFIKKAMSFVHQLRPTLSFDVNTGAPQISVDARVANAPDSLGAVMGMIRRLANDERICVVFDEFQDILDIDRSDVVLAEMRSTIQFQPVLQVGGDVHGWSDWIVRVRTVHRRKVSQGRQESRCGDCTDADRIRRFRDWRRSGALRGDLGHN